MCRELLKTVELDLAAADHLPIERVWLVQSDGVDTSMLLTFSREYLSLSFWVLTCAFGTPITNHISGNLKFIRAAHMQRLIPDQTDGSDGT